MLLSRKTKRVAFLFRNIKFLFSLFNEKNYNLNFLVSLEGKIHIL